MKYTRRAFIKSMFEGAVVTAAFVALPVSVLGNIHGKPKPKPKPPRKKEMSWGDFIDPRVYDTSHLETKMEQILSKPCFTAEYMARANRAAVEHYLKNQPIPTVQPWTGRI